VTAPGLDPWRKAFCPSATRRVEDFGGHAWK